MKLILKGNPLSTQSIYRYTCIGKFARFYMAKTGKKLKELYQTEIKNQYKGKILSGDCDMEMTLFFKDKRRRDVDNYNKLVLDSLEGIVLEDDCQIQRLKITKDYSAENPRIELEIKGSAKEGLKELKE